MRGSQLCLKVGREGGRQRKGRSRSREGVKGSGRVGEGERGKGRREMEDVTAKLGFIPG